MGLSKKTSGKDILIEHDETSSSRSQAATHAKSIQTRHEQDPATVLVMGRSGSGKTQLITHICECCDPSQSRILIASQGTKDPKSHRVPLSNKSILKAVDTPGLDNVNMSDLEVFARVAMFLRDPARADPGLTRIVYIHPAGDTIRSRTLQQNLRTILDLFIVKAERIRLTILVVPTSAQGVDPKAVVEDMRRSNLAIFRDLIKEGASLVAATANQDLFGDFLRSYALQPPIFPPIYLIECDPRDLQPTIEFNIETSLGYCEKQSVHSRILSYEKELVSHGKKINELQASATRYQEKFEDIRVRSIDQQKTESSLRQQLQEVKSDYAFLRSQVQARDNHDQEGVAKGLTNMNKDLEDTCQSISEYIVDSWVKDVFGRDPSEVSTLDAIDSAKLRLALGHRDGKSSLVESSSGKGLGVEDFFDFSTRALLCDFLSEKIFRPFHPRLDLSNRELESVHNAFVACYGDVQKHEPQYMAGKWRSIAFRSIGNMKRQDSQPKIDAKVLTQDFLQNRLLPLLSAFFGRKRSELSLKQQHNTRLYQLVDMAWEWNCKLKEEVITLGDYTQTMYPTGTEFDSAFMEELQVESGPSSRRRRPTSILGTLALGLVCYRATGEQGLVRTVLEKALVATDCLYA